LPPEGPRDFVANAAQALIGAESALERLGLIGNAGDDVAELREAIHTAQALCLRALFALNSGEVL
jgi:hypothetical protein